MAYKSSSTFLTPLYALLTADLKRLFWGAALPSAMALIATSPVPGKKRVFDRLEATFD